MPFKYSVTEPPPSTTSYIRTGRGGAGNVRPSTHFNNSTTTTSASNNTSTTSNSARPRRFFTGIGGAGNVASAGTASSPLDDAISHAAARDSAPPLGYCGRGGAGNRYYNAPERYVRKPSDASTSSAVSEASSARSSMSSTAKLWARVTHKQ